MNSITYILTDKGIRRIKDLLGKPCNIIVNDNIVKSVNFELDGKKDTYKIILQNGLSLLCSADQKFVDIYGETVSIHDLIRDPLSHILKLNKNDTFWISDNGSYEEGYVIGLIACRGMFYYSNKLNKNSFLIRLKIPVRYSKPSEYKPYANLINYLINTGAEYEIELHMSTDKWKEYSIKSPDLRTLAIRHGIYDGHRNLYEYGCYEFSRGQLQSIFDVESEIYIDKKCGVFIQTHGLTNTQAHILQNLLFAFGISCDVIQSYVVIKNKIDLIKFHVNIGFTMNEKTKDLLKMIDKYKLCCKSCDTDRFVSKILSIEHCNKSDVYKCSNPFVIANNILVAN